MQLGKKNSFSECEAWCLSKARVTTTTRVKKCFSRFAHEFFLLGGQKNDFFPHTRQYNPLYDPLVENTDYYWAFGGDPKRVTLSGGSDGGANVSFHALLDLGTGKCITQVRN